MKYFADKRFLRCLTLTVIFLQLSFAQNNMGLFKNNTGDPSDMPYGPNFSIEELLSWDISSDPDAPYNKSSIPLKTRFLDNNTQVNSHARTGEAGVSPLVLFSGGDIPSQGSADLKRVYPYSYWQYTDIMGYWGGTAGQCITMPAGAVIDIAHKNGVEIFGNVFLAPVAYGGNIQTVEDFLQKDGEIFPVADKMIEAAEYFGFDGWFINQETAGGTSSLANKMVDFLKYIKSNSSIKVYWYDAMTEYGSVYWQNELTSSNDKFFQDDSVLVSDYMFLNFWWFNSSKLSRSKTKARSLGRSEYDIYAGIDCAIEGYETYVDWDRLFPEGEEHNTSVGLYRPDDFLWFQSSSLEENQEREKRFWSGANGDPSNTETNHGWKSFAHYVPAFSVINELPFFTNFCTGAGKDFYINGEKMSHYSRSENGWNNIGLQDILPTWRWIVESSGEKLDVDFDFTDAYYGGSSLNISGNLTADNHIKLYKTKLTVSSDTKLEIAFKAAATGTTNMKVGFAFKDSPADFSYIEVGDAESTDWKLATLDLGSFAGRTISVISLFFDGGAGSDYEMKVGRIGIYNSSKAIPSAPASFYIDKKTNEADYVTLRLRWTNTDPNINHYNVYRINPDDSRTYLGGSTTDACFIPWIGQEQGDTNVVIEVEAVGNDFSHSDKVTASFIWYSQPAKAANPSPANNTEDVVRNPKLVWTKGAGSTHHDIYLSTDPENLELIATVTENEFEPGLLEENTTYYWRVDEKNLLYETAGDLWSFTTGSVISAGDNRALEFDGANDYLNCGNHESLQITGSEITIEAWINPTSFKDEVYQGCIVTKERGGNMVDFGYMIRCGKNGIVNFNIGNGTWNEINTPANSVKLNTWHHVTGVLDGGYMKIYIDGIELAKVYKSSLQVMNASSTDLLIGESQYFSDRVFPGKIDEVRLWNVARSQQQIQDYLDTHLPQTYYSTPDSGLVGYWKMDEGSGQVANDLSYYSNHGTLGGSDAIENTDPLWVESTAIVSVDAEEEKNILPEEYSLDQNYPNPFNPSTTIGFTVVEPGIYKIKIYNSIGQEVSTLFSDYINSGSHELQFNAANLSSGIYFYRLTGAGVNITKKMILLK